MSLIDPVLDSVEGVAVMSSTVVITTKNRKEDLRLAIASAVSQTAKPEVLVIDDGSTDGTSDMVKAEFPAVRLESVERSLGLIVQRNRGGRLAHGDVIFSIDDDAAFSTPNIVERTLRDFDDPRIGAVAIPFATVRQGPEISQRAPEGQGVFATSEYVGTAHALRRELFLNLGGYRETLFHQGEERDYCLRMLDAGYIVRLGRSDPIHHFESPRRDLRRMDVYGRRNDVLFAWHNVPWPNLPVHLLGTTLNGLRFGLRVGRVKAMANGLAMGWASVVGEWGRRSPVSRSIYALHRELRKGPRRLDEIERLLPKLRVAP